MSGFLGEIQELNLLVAFDLKAFSFVFFLFFNKNIEPSTLIFVPGYLHSAYLNHWRNELGHFNSLLVCCDTLNGFTVLPNTIALSIVGPKVCTVCNPLVHKAL